MVAVSALKILFEREKGIVLVFERIVSLSFGVKSPSGPIKTHNDLTSLKSFISKLFFELISANKSLVD